MSHADAESNKGAQGITVPGWIALVSTLVHLPPLIYHAIGRVDGSIPDAEAWERLGGNHGPLWHRSEGSILPAVLGVQALIVPVVLVAAVASLSQGFTRRELLRWLLLFVYVGALVWFVSPVWAWTID